MLARSGQFVSSLLTENYRNRNLIRVNTIISPRAVESGVAFSFSVSLPSTACSPLVIRHVEIRWLDRAYEKNSHLVDRESVSSRSCRFQARWVHRVKSRRKVRVARLSVAEDLLTLGVLMSNSSRRMLWRYFSTVEIVLVDSAIHLGQKSFARDLIATRRRCHA